MIKFWLAKWIAEAIIAFIVFVAVILFAIWITHK